MGRWFVVAAIASGMTAVAAFPGHAGPGAFLERLLTYPPAAFSDKPEEQKARRPSAAPATAPLPRLRPVVATTAAPSPSMPAAASAPPTTKAPTLLSYGSSAESDPARDAEAPVPVGVTSSSTDDEDTPMPRLRPASATEAVNDVAFTAASVTGGGLRIASLPAEPMPKLTRPPPAASATCGVALASLGVALTPLPPIEEGECGVTQPVAITALSGGAVDFTAKAIVGCETAETVANFVRTSVEPAARRTFGEELTGLRIAASYACRNRDNLPDTKLSEHARGNAIDISGFRIGDRWIEVESGWAAGGKDTAFLKTVRKAACGPFATVLGPGSDSFHTDHFHLDTIRRGKHGRALYCH